MIKFISIICLCLLFSVAYAADPNTLSFTPPPGDYSVVFLEDVFGVVDGVLAGSGSQIMGRMFAVFNATVLALGGIVILYIVIVGTLNTAQEGTMLGQKWNSLWVPVRATLGLALLMPKASGYCLMQIFVMWIVVQGVGAADKLWNAALNYLNNGGVIIRGQPSSQATLSTGDGQLAAAAAAILTNQVCMLGVQTMMENLRQIYTNAQSDNPTICTSPQNSDVQAFCSASVPNFLSTFNAVATQQANPGATQFSVPVPNFDKDSPYASLNGLCGTISWTPLTAAQISALTPYTAPPPPGITGEESSTSNSVAGTATETTAQVTNDAELTPAIASQEMYSELALIATNIVTNDPQFVYPPPSSSSVSSSPFAPWANSQYGVAYNSSDTVCTSATGSGCPSWGLTSGLATSLLFNGTEFQNAIQSYNAVIQPTLNLIAEGQNGTNSAKSFISTSEIAGWMTAGSYFFNLITLNGNAASATSTLTSFAKQTMNYTKLATACQSPSSPYSLYCTVLGNPIIPSQNPQNIINLIQGSPSAPVNPAPVSSTLFTQPQYIPMNQSGANSSTVFGFIYNSAMITLPGQPGFTAPTFDINLDLAPPTNSIQLQQLSFECGNVAYIGCIGETIATALYDGIVQPIFSSVLNWINSVFSQIVQAFLSVPMQAIGSLFVSGVSYLGNPGTNPIVSLAQMGTAYINYAMELWIDLITASFLFVFFPGFAIMMVLILPILMSWLGVMVTIGYATAYYIPFVPYMLFTFGVLAWLSAVVEAMVGAPIVALGITHPDGEGLLGNGEQGIMLLLNVFLRPAMMIVGYIAGISLCYVGVWILNTGYQQIAVNIQSGNSDIPSPSSYYSGWAGMYGGFMAIVMYTTLYMTIAQKSFNLIYMLPDKVLRWIKGGSAENAGEATAQWSEESKGQMKTAGDESSKAGASTSAKMDTKANAAIGQARDMMSGGEGGARPGGDK